MFSSQRISLFAVVLAAGALSACREDAVMPGPVSPAAVPTVAPTASPASASTATDPGASPTDKAPAPNSGGEIAAKTEPAADATTKAAGGNIIGQVTTTPAKANNHVVVFLEDAPEATDKQPSAVIDQRKMMFGPFITALPVGGKVIFRNNDPFPHNIFSPDNERFDLGTMSQGNARVRVFKTAGAYTLLCNIHPGMLAYIYVTPSSYYALTDKDGKFVMKNVPAGTHKLGAWGPKLGTISQPVTVTGGDLTVNLELHRGS